MPGQTIVAHWNDHERSWLGGSEKNRWALVEPNLAALIEERSKLSSSIERLQAKLDSIPEATNQLAAAREEEAELSSTIEQYKPDENAPECIAEGGQGSILVGKCLDSGCKVAIKVERVQQGREGTLQAEYDILCALSGDKRFPDVYHYGRQMLNCSPKATDVKVMVMQLLGSSVRELWWKRTRGSRGLEPATVMNLGCRMLEVLEQLHLKGYIHRDLKPANFAMSGDEGGDKGRGQLCLIDFGIASPIANEQAKAEEASKGSSLSQPAFYGTRMFASRAAHKGKPQSFGDDLEAVVYVLSYLLNGALPWGDAAVGSSLEGVGGMKSAAIAAVVAGECDDESSSACALVRCAESAASGAALKELLLHSDGLGFGELPDYTHCQGVLRTAYTSETAREQLSDDYEWNRPPEEAETQAPPRSSGAGCVDFLDLF